MSMAATKAKPVDRAAVIEELGLLEKELHAAHADLAKKLGTKTERMAMLRAQVVAWFEDADAEKPFVVESVGFVATTSARSNETAITNMPRVQTLLGSKRFRELARIGLTDLRKALTAEQLASCTKTTRTGTRSLAVVEKGTK
jgi:hypothetical protein